MEPKVQMVQMVLKDLLVQMELKEHKDSKV